MFYFDYLSHGTPAFHRRDAMKSSSARPKVGYNSYGEHYRFLGFLPRGIFLRRAIVLTLVVVSLAGFLALHRRSLLEYRLHSLDLPLDGIAVADPHGESGVSVLARPWNSSATVGNWLRNGWSS
ncbi:hypothetical protein F4779DRAFT_613721 [Xylariaceae sp. FL0662B]|nr:hypothetical protein F4779DRAFT_613721 [Xylariaceae sp. FL0662B]